MFAASSFTADTRDRLGGSAVEDGSARLVGAHRLDHQPAVGAEQRAHPLAQHAVALGLARRLEHQPRQHRVERVAELGGDEPDQVVDRLQRCRRTSGSRQAESAPCRRARWRLDALALITRRARGAGRGGVPAHRTGRCASPSVSRARANSATAEASSASAGA
jgi:hypothetical protein